MSSQVGFLLPEVVGVIGAGQASVIVSRSELFALKGSHCFQMGAGIAQTLVSRGIKVILSDRRVSNRDFTHAKC